jgi:hypothetical protein
MLQSFGNSNITVSASTFNQYNEVFLGLTESIGEVFIFSGGGLQSQTKSVGLYDQQNGTQLIMKVYSLGTTAQPFQPFTITFGIECPICVECTL